MPDIEEPVKSVVLKIKLEGLDDVQDKVVRLSELLSEAESILEELNGVHTITPVVKS